MLNELFVTCSQELETLLLDELQALGFERVKKGFRGVYVEITSPKDIYKINYCSRLASRVLLPLKNFRCYNAESLYRDAKSINWAPYIPAGKTIAIDSNVTHRQLKNSLYAAQVVKDAICDQLVEKRGKRPSVDVQDPDVQLNLYIRDNLASLSFDTSGSPLHKRGYRIESVEAPMQETLAAALLKLADYKEQEILFDPCCGSGTLLIEAALLASETPPGYLRQKWGFTRLPEFSQQEWLEVKAEADKKRKEIPHGRIYGCDINKNAVRVCKTNLRAAGFNGIVEITLNDFREFTPAPPPTLVCTNPPHGKRLDDVESLKPFYRALGEFLKEKTAHPSRGFIFTGSLELAKEVGLAPKKRHVLYNSGIESRYLEFDIY